VTNTDSHEQPVIWSTPRGRISLLPLRGRVLQIEAAGQPCLWNPPQVTAPWNLGGERLWLGPESDWFWKKTDRVDFHQYQVPPGLDPDSWQITSSSATAAEVELRLELRCPHADRHLRLHVRRRFELLDEKSLAARPGAVGLAITTTLTINDGTPGQPVDLWAVIQVPVGGTMVVPTLMPAVARDYFDPCPAGEMQISPRCFQLRIGGATMFKLGVSPVATAGRIAYLRPARQGTLVLERFFPVLPALAYADTPLQSLGSPGDAAQFFNDGGKFGVFGEMEHRSPALLCGRGPQSYTETTITAAACLDDGALATWRETFGAGPGNDL
jgi:hypothetical protein